MWRWGCARLGQDAPRAASLLSTGHEPVTRILGGFCAQRVGPDILLVLCIVVAFFLEIPRLVDENQNKLVKKPPYTASEAALSLHKELTIADLHADSLLWGRDLLERGTDGHVDIPRLADGNVALQVFSLPTKSPHGLNIESNEDKNDDIFWLAIVGRWPPGTWNSLTERALYQARRLHRFANGSAAASW